MPQEKSLEKICYKKNYLKEVIININFTNPIHELQKASLPIQIKKIVEKRYPIPAKGKRIEGIIKISSKGEPIKEEKKEIPQWIYHGIKRDKIIKIDEQIISVALHQYNNYEDLRQDIINPINSIIKIGKNVEIKTTSLRYINIFTDIIRDYNDIKKYFVNMISSSFENLIDKDNCSRNFLITEYLLDNDIKIRMQTGIYNPNYPARISRKDFIIDIEAFLNTPHIMSDSRNFIDELHLNIQKKFEDCITDDLRGVLNEK